MWAYAASQITALHLRRLNQTESPNFVILCVLSFLFHFYFIWRVLCQIITKTCLYKFEPLKLYFYIVKLGFTRVYIIFLIFAQNIDCQYSLEPLQQGVVVLTSTHNLCYLMLLSRNMKNTRVVFFVVFFF